MRPLSIITRKLLMSVAAFGAAASVAGLGTFAAFTSSTNASNSVSTGTIDLALGAAGAVTNRLSLDVTELAPGMVAQRSFDLRNTGSEPFHELELTTQATSSSMLDTDAVNGLQMQVLRCSTPWIESGTSPLLTYTCLGTQTAAIASRPVIGSSLPLSGADLAAGATNHLLLKLTLPLTASDLFQNRTSTLLYTFRATS